ncbi:MAG: SoxR reducing system RseC family protein [Rhodocyclaceae bacterium]|nr:SoxR reducing system RseC family protein [Rhodocyclaceae bacterium]
MEQEAIVAGIEGEYAYVQLDVGGGCGRCHETGGCQSGILGQLFGSQPRRFRISNRIGAKPGDRVLVRVADGVPLRVAMLTYLLPALFLLFGAATGTALRGDSDAWAALGALTGLVIGVLAGLTFRRSLMDALPEPVLVRHNQTICFSKEACR